MQHVLITGGAGGLGRQITSRLVSAGYTVSVMSRSQTPTFNPGAVEWKQADLASGEGLAQAVKGAGIIVHSASHPLHSQQVDVEGTRRLLELAAQAGAAHILFVSIVGIERIPFPYYKAKLAAEKLVENSGLPYSILRATQFHTFIDGLVLPMFLRLPISLFPADFQFQPIDTGEVAGRIAECVREGPGGRLADIGGPQVHTLGDLLRSWLAARGQRRWIIPLRYPGAVAAGFRQGFNTTPHNRYGRIGWEEWLQGMYNTSSRQVLDAHA